MKDRTKNSDPNRDVAQNENKVIARSDCAGATNKVKGSLVKCEVKLESGKWISPAIGSTFKIDLDAVFPEIVFEIETEVSGPYEWSWDIKWNALACPQRRDRKRFKAKKSKVYTASGRFTSESKKWRANLDNQIVGGELTVRVKAGSKNFIKRVNVIGSEPGEIKIKEELTQYAVNQARDVELAKRIFRQESNFCQFYSDGEPLVSFDNGYGLGQATQPVPSFEQVWNWKAHIKYILETVIKEKRILAKNYLNKHGNYTDEDLDMETLVYYNGANYHYLVWDGSDRKWIENKQVVCDPEQSNSGWDMKSNSNKDKSISQLRKGEGDKPKYTGRCYAEHIKNQGDAK